MPSHQDAKTWAEQGFMQAMGRSPTVAERQFVQAVALIESGYGAGWKGEGIGSNNMGAVQTRSTDPSVSFGYTDTHPNDSGGSVPYAARFKKYPSPQAGMADVAHILYRQMGIAPDSIAGVSSQMYDRHYYEGFGKTREERIANHARALTNALSKITAALGEPMPAGGSLSAPPKPTTTPVAPSAPYSSQRFWSELRSCLETAPSGMRALETRSPKCRELIMRFQAARGLVVDGHIGPLTLGAALDRP